MMELKRIYSEKMVLKKLDKKLNIEFIGEIPLMSKANDCKRTSVVELTRFNLIKDIFISFAKKIDDILSKKS